MTDRIVRRRAPGWRMPEGAVYVGRPSPWGNPVAHEGAWIAWAALAIGFRADLPGRRAAAAEIHRAWLTGLAIRPGGLDLGGGDMEFSDGRVVSMGEHLRGLAGGFAALYQAPTMPELPDLAPLLGAKGLACWCPEDGACHADNLIEVLSWCEACRDREHAATHYGGTQVRCRNSQEGAPWRQCPCPVRLQ